MTLANGYVWLMFAWYPEHWWQAKQVQRPYTLPNCTTEQLESVILDGILIDHYSFVSDKNAVTDIGLVSGFEVWNSVKIDIS